MNIIKKKEYLDKFVSTSPPVGTIFSYAGDVVPDGWVICNGATISRNDYSELFNIIGTTYGNGDGSTTFNLPNLKGKVMVARQGNI